MPELTKTATEIVLSPTLHSNETVAKRRAEGLDIYHMGFGEAPFPVPEKMKNALCDHAGHNEYIATGGLPALKDQVKKYYRQKTNVPVDAYDVFIAPGSKLILYAMQMAIKGDLLLPNPSWVSYAPQAKMLGDKIKLVEVETSDKGLIISEDNLKQAIAKARAEGQDPKKIILNSPSNPTGLIIPDDNLARIAEICCEEDIFIISDEIYTFITFDGTYNSISKYAPENTTVSGGLSKQLSLGGWRLGVCFVPKAIKGLYERLCCIASETWSSVPAPVQYAAIKAYEGDPDIEEHIADFTAIHAYMNRYLAKGLREAGFNAPLPQGGFYNYPDFSPYRDVLKYIGIETSQELADYLLAEYGLATLPGSGFGGQPDDLRLRMAGCDYDGGRVLNAYRKAGKQIDSAFIKEHAPHIHKQVEIFSKITSDLKNNAASVSLERDSVSSAAE